MSALGCLSICVTDTVFLYYTIKSDFVFQYYDLAADVLAENAHLTYKYLTNVSKALKI